METGLYRKGLIKMSKRHLSTEDIENLLNRFPPEIRSPRGAFSAKQSYSRLKRRIQPSGKKRSLRWYHYASAAAILVTAGLFALQFLLPDTTPEMIRISATDHVRKISLPDGSSLSLSRHSSLVYPEKFIGKTREVHLEGKGYFEVAKDQKRPFIVRVQDVDVEVLGTHFNVQAYPNDSIVRTTLLEGAVAVSNPYNSQRLLLQPNETAVFNRNSHKLVRQENPQATEDIAWTKGTFLFNRTTLEEIARELSDFYGVPIRIESEKLKSYRLTGCFKQEESLDQILSLLQSTGNFTYSQTGDTIQLRPNSNHLAE